MGRQVILTRFGSNTASLLRALMHGNACARRGFLLVLLVGVTLSANALASEPVRCMRGISPDNPRQTTTKMTGDLPLAQPITIHYKGEFYRIPLGYLIGGGWGIPRHSARDKIGFNLKGVNEFNELGFYFWMPDLRFSEADIVSSPNFRHCENGRIAPTKSQPEYLVKVLITELRRPREDLVVTPAYLYETTLERWGKEFVSHKNIHGLVEFIDKNDSGPDRDRLFKNRQGAKYQAFIKCVSTEIGWPNPLCDAQFYYPDEQLFFRMRFPVDALPHWQTMIQSMRQLLQQWKQEAADNQDS
jgi:hypothetical protein